MSNKSDYTKPRTNIYELLPEVYRSDINNSVFETSFNRHLSKDETKRVVGYIGQGNPNALLQRQLPEPTPHRQAFQLQPTVYTKIGTVEYVRSYYSLLSELELMGVSKDRLPQWGNALLFNWVPPVDIDKLINFRNYFWDDPARSSANYITIENRCNKAQAKVDAYKRTLSQKGNTLPIVQVPLGPNAFVISGSHVDLFVEGFVFYTKNTVDQNVANKYWTTVSSTYDTDDNQTTIVVLEDIAIRSGVTPVASFVGQWWYNTTSGQSFKWDGAIWVNTAAVQVVVADISLTELLSVFEAARNCACSGDFGWDIGLWDDNQVGSIVWNTTLLTSISHATEAAWIVANGLPTLYAIWYDTTSDELKQYDGANWIVVQSNFSALVTRTVGTYFWDKAAACEVITDNQWSWENYWASRSQLASTSGLRPASLPILEYSASVERNSWYLQEQTWKYREANGGVFKETTEKPSRLELEPVRGFEVVGNQIYLYMGLGAADDVDLTDVFTPGFVFTLRDDTYVVEPYTVESAVHRELTVDADQMVTIITVVEPINPIFTKGGLHPTASPAEITQNARVEPLFTSAGDYWDGYNVHWLFVGEETPVPIASQCVNPLLEKESAANSPQTNIVDTPTAVITEAKYFQEWVLKVAGVTTITFSSVGYSIIYDPLANNIFALAGTDDLRVYRNGIRQYGTYDENTTTLNNRVFVSGITFSQPLESSDIIRIEVGSKANSDMGSYVVQARTIEDDVAYTAAMLGGTQPEYISLTHLHLNEQVKVEVNQYPLFNIYRVDTGEVIQVSPIIAYRTSQDEPVDARIGQRIVISADGRDYEFENLLIAEEDGELYAYRDYDLAVSTYWYNPETNALKMWSGTSWCTEFTVLVDEGAGDIITTQVPVISTAEPTYLLPVNGSIWYNPDTNELWQRDTVTVSWVALTTPHVGTVDKGLRTIWRHGTNMEEYVPEYVDADREPVPVNDPAGGWEIPDQLYYNSEHKNRQFVKYTEFFTHFRSIINEQAPIPGILGSAVFAYTVNDYNYGLGGTIKDHNDSYDTLLSAVNIKNATPITILEFAEEQYSSALLSVRELFSKYGMDILTVFSNDSLSNLSEYVVNELIDRYERNDYTAQLYFDTSAYVVSTNTGVANWISTTPMFCLHEKVQPELLIDDDLGIIEIVHHDGHRSQVNISTGEIDRFCTLLVNEDDPRTDPVDKIGRTSPLAPPATETAFVALFNDITRVGVYWYRVGGGFRNLYRWSPVSTGNVAPSFMDVNGDEYPDGTFWYNATSNTLYTKVGLTWQVVTAIGDGIIASAWEEVRIDYLIAETIFEIENRLYAVSPECDELVFDFAGLTPTPEEQAYYDRYMAERFEQYARERDIVSPLAASTFSSTDPFTWNYSRSTLVDHPEVGVLPASVVVPGDWRELYTRLYGTPYPHLEPWKMQGFEGKPTWWDDEYLDTTNTRRWIFTPAGAPVYHPNVAPNIGTGMWQNIYAGIIPIGRFAPDGSPGTGLVGQVTQWYYFSVNTSNATLTGGYGPDAVLPPFYNTADPLNRPPFTNYSGQIAREGADYNFGEVGPTEYEWRVASEFVYDEQIVAFLMQPVRYMHYAFGIEFIEVDALQIDKQFREIYSHEDAKFHGDLYDGNNTFYARGLNQWYVNYNRARGYDTNEDFRGLWIGWNPLLTYQFSGCIDTSSFQVTTKYFDVTNADYNIVLAKDPFFKNLWLDTFRVAAAYAPPSTIAYNSQYQWRFEIDIQSPVVRPVSYYGVHNYPFTVDVVNNKGILNRFTLSDIDPMANTFFVSGDQTQVFAPVGLQFVISGSLGNNGTWTVTSATYDYVSDQTAIHVVETIPSPSLTGVISIPSRVLPWNTGDAILITANVALPAPLELYTTYYIIKLSNTEFRLAYTQTDALNGIPLVLTSAGTGQTFIGQLLTTFFALGDPNNVWYHYAINKDDVRTFIPVAKMTGIQTMVNIFDGYAAYQRDEGIIVGNTELLEMDPLLNRPVGWELEIERFISWALNVRRYINKTVDKFSFSINTVTDQCTFTTLPPVWSTGKKIIITSTGTLPAPLIANVPYYLVRDPVDTTKFKVSASANTTNTANLVDFTTAGTGIVSLQAYEPRATYPVFEVNPSRNNVWINTPQGIVGNISTSVIEDVHVQQVVFDQYGRQLPANAIVPLRQDKQMRIAVRGEIPNDVDPPVVLAVPNPYNFLHMGGGHFFIEGYEHDILFNDYTTDGDLLYDQFLGLNVARFEVDFLQQNTATFRPVIGGYYLLGNTFRRNIEGSVEDMRSMYDTYKIPETNPITQMARASLGYDGPHSYLTQINAGPKSQFLFWKGKIQAKGSTNSIKAFINSKRFVDAKVDEFWAYKIAEFGDSRIQQYPAVNVDTTDIVDNDIRLLFLGSGDDASAFVDDTNNGFALISMLDQDRWQEYPDQQEALRNSALFLDAGVTSREIVLASATPPPVGQENMVDFWLDTTTNEIKQFDPLAIDPADAWDIVEQKVNFDGGLYIYRLKEIADDIRIVRQTVNPSDLRETSLTTVLTGGDFEQINTESFKIGPTFYGLLTIFTINPLKTKLNPAKIIDTKAQTVISDVTFWDPARNHHFYRAAHNIDLFNDNDPALYNNTFNTQLYVSDQPWADTQVGTTWLETNRLGYTTYYDGFVYPNINTRLALWGQRAPWADVRVYEWTESPLPPEQWSTVVQQDLGNASIPFNQKRSGTPRTTTFRRKRNAYVFASATDVNIGTDVITLPTSSGLFQIDSPIIFGATDVDTGELPEPLVAGTVYYVVAVPGANQVQISDTLGGPPIDLTTIGSEGTGQLQAVPEFTDDMWRRFTVRSQRFLAAIEYGLAPGPGPYTLTLNSEFEPEDIVQVFVNGIEVNDLATLTVDLLNQVTFSTTVSLTEKDFIDVVRPDYPVTTSQQTFDPEAADDGVTLTQWTTWLETTQTYRLNANGALEPLYYFWVENKTSRDNTIPNMLSLQEVVSQLIIAPEPYMVLQTPVTDGYGTGGYGVVLYGDGQELFAGLLAPAYYQRAIVRGISNMVRSDDRYVVRFTRDFTLRDDLKDATTPNSLKKRYVQWEMFREQQTYKVNQILWNRMIEAIIGYKLDDNTIRVPALERELYDLATGSDTQYGLGDGQAFVNGQMALATIQDDLRDPNNNFHPIDIDQFFVLNNFDTPAATQQALENIYNTFATEDVNRIFFKVLLDAFTTKSKYEEIFKTSWVSLYGVRVLEVNGIYDD